MSQLKKSDPINVGNDDPFAELTRIMGFDPRVSVKKAGPQAANVSTPPAAPESAPAADALDEFDFDLEKELMGDFASELTGPAALAPATQVAHTEQASEAMPLPAAVAPALEDFDIDLERELQGDFALELEVPQAIAEAAHVEPLTEQPSAPATPEASVPVEEEFEQAFAASLDLEPVEAPLVSGPEASEPVQMISAVAERHEEASLEVDDTLGDIDFDVEFAKNIAADLHAEPASDAPLVEAAAVMPVPAPAVEPAVAQVEPVASNLEDELTALLNSLGSRSNPNVASSDPARWASRANHVAIQPAPVVQPAPAVQPAAQEDAVPAQHAEEQPFHAEAEAVASSSNVRSSVHQDLDDLLQVMTAEVEALDQASELSAYNHAPMTMTPTGGNRRYTDISEPAQAEGDVLNLETVDVPEPAYAYADDLDIPEIAFDEPAPARSAYDDYGHDYDNATHYGEAPHAEEPVSHTATTSPRTDFDADFDALYRQVREAASAPAFAAPPTQHYDSFAADQPLPGELPLSYDDEVVMPNTAPIPLEGSRRRGAMIAAVVGGVALLGIAGAFALSYGGGNSDGGVPVVVQADTDPVKVKPENPGGTAVPNQDSKVFETLARGDAAPAEPVQERLVSSTEEPVDIAAGDPDADTTALAAMPKGEDRIDPETAGSTESANEEVVAVAPRKVKTMVVKSDGTLVPREEAAPVPFESALKPASGTTAALPATAPIAPAAAAPATPTAPVAEATAAPAAAEAPLTAPAPTGTEQLAMAAPMAAAAGASWSMQIASQPSAESAQATYEDLAKRYGSVIGGRGVNIVKADIAGKGTYWRVRVPAATKNEAIQLCESYKAAGGNCFVSR